MAGLVVSQVHKSFGETAALRGVSFEVALGEIVAVLGPSGCGKSTLLAVIAGLESPDHGEIRWEGQTLAGVPPQQRGFGLMFQDFALFPHMNVFNNVAFGLRMTHLDGDQLHQRVAEMLDLVGLSGFERRDVNALSGGEQQRVALARSLAPQPRVLMLDEPLGSLDRTLRERLMLDLRSILSRVGQTALYVTHDQEEAFALADRVILMDAGQVVQIAPPQEIYQQPATPFVARFLGLSNLLTGTARHEPGGWVIDTPIGSFPLPAGPSGGLTVLLRPDRVHLDGEGVCQIEGLVKERSFRGARMRAVVEINGMSLSFDFDPLAPLPQEGQVVRLRFDPAEALQVFV